jgi:hypothetical protein
LQQDRGHPAALSLLGVAVLAGAAAIATSYVAAPQAESIGPLLSSGSLLPTFGPAPVDLVPDDDETARELKNRVADANGTAVTSALAHLDFALAVAPKAQLVAPGRTTFSLGPRAPPHARNFDRRRPAWQA